MKKTTLRQAALKLAIVAFVLLSPLGLRAQQTLTVNEGTATNSYVPFYGYYMDYPGNTSEFIIPADQLENMVGGTISKLTFYLSGSFTSWGSPTVQIYLGEVEGTTLSSTYGPTNFTVVYTGVVSNQTNPMVIEFDETYDYEGGNLLIGTLVQEAGSYRSTSFYGVSATSGSSINIYSSSPNPQSFLPKTTFEYEPAQQGGCDKPGQITLGTAGATQYPISWTAGGEETSWNVYLTQEGSPVAGYNPLVVNTTPSCTFSGLTAGTTYDVAIEAICGSEVSAQRTKSFTTALCEASDRCEISIYRTDSYDDSWNGGSIAIMQNGNLVATVNCPSGFSGTTVNYAVCKGVPVSFVFTRGSYPGEIGVTITDGGGEVVYEATGMSSVSAGTFLTIDNACPSCYKVLNLTHSDETTDGVTLTWEADTRNDAGVTTYTIFNVTDNVVYASGVTATSQIVSGLNENTPYEFTVTTDCGSGDLAEAATVNFTTLASCPAPTATLTDNSVTAHGATIQWNDMGSTGYNVRWQVSNTISEGFENGSLNDWDLVNSNSGNTGVTTNAAHNSNYGFKFYYDETNDASLISPVLSGTEDGVTISFYYKEESNNYGDEQFYVGYSTNETAEAPADFTYGNIVTASLNWQLYENSFPAGTKRIAIKYVYNDALALYIDDIDITIPNDNWTTVNDITNTNYTITGLTAETRYLAQVQSVCGEDVSSWSEGVSFTTTIACPAPTTLTNGTPSPSQVELTWVKNGEETEWQICINNNEENLVDVAEADVNVNPETSVVTYTLTNLTPSTSYEIKVRANCGDVDGPSAWTSPVSFTTQAACPTPVLSADGITNITAHTADVEWSNFTENTNYEVSYRTAAYFDGVTEEFGTTPTGWAQYTGLLSNVMNGTALTSVTSGWFFGTGNGVFDNHARVNIYSTYCNRWLVTPALTVPENGALTFDMALTAFSGNLAAPQTSGTDDKFVVLITTDEMATWTVLRQWDNAGSEYVYNNIPYSATGENVMINLGEYVGQTVQVAFYGESTVSNADNNLHIDNVGVGAAVAAGEWQTQNVTENSLQLTNLVAETPYDVKVAGYCDATVAGESDTLTFTTTIACPVPTGLDTVGDATTNSVDLTWTAGAANQDAWQICLNGDETNLLDVTDATVTGTTVTYTLTGLTAGADYSVKVRANCGNVDGVSLQWTNTVNFTTEASCTEPTAFAVVENSVEAHQAQLSWTAGGEETAWDIYYSNTNSAPVNGVTEPTVEAIAANPYTLAGLDAATTYYVWVRAHCGDAAGQQSPWVGPVTFTTECEAKTIDANNIYTDNFDSYTGSGDVSTGTVGPSNYPGHKMPLCWNFLNMSENTSNIPQAFLSSYSGYNVTGNSLFFRSSSNTPIYAILPEFTNNISDLMLTFTYRNEGVSASNGTLIVGYMTDPTDASSFVTVLTCNQTTTLTEKEVFFADAPAGSYMAFKYQGGTSNNFYLSIDNVSVALAPTCRKPSDLMLETPSARTAHTATLKWTNGEEGQTAWQIAYSTEANFAPDNDFTPDGTTTWLVDATTNPFTINGLNANTPYRAYVRANCGNENGVSNWSVLPANFSTLAGDNAPTGLAVSGITSSTATASWTGNTANDLHQLYELYFSTDATAPTDDTEPTHTSNEASYTFTGLTPETQYFVWVRDNCGDDGYSTWVGSASFTTLELCPTPTDLVANNITNNAATLSWNDVNDSYNFRYRVAAGLMSIFSEDFSNGIGDWTMQNCEARTGVSNGTFRFYYRSNPPQYLISPEITGINSDAIVEFNYWNNSTTYDETFQVGLSSTTNDVDAFSWSETITAADQIHYTYHATVPAGTKYIAIKLLSDDQFYLYIDDIVIGESVNAGEWVEINNITENSVDLVGLTAETKYEAQVQGVCSSLSMNTEWTEALSFTTKSFCEKEILANRWYAISSPMHNDGNNETLAGVNNLTSGTYDLYGYNEATGTWEKPTTSLNRGKGYIYRRSNDATLQFVGDANTGSVSVSLTSSCSDNDLKGFNLIGNPYPHAVAINQPHYTLNPNGTWTAHTSNNTIGVAEAFLVYSTYSPNTYYFSDVTPSTNTASASLAFTVSTGEYSDVAYARLEEGEGLPKIGHLAANAPMLSIPVEGRRYAIANLGSDCQSFDMVFRGTGTYTLSFNGNTGYCHLIDRVAGKDIDMLRQNYTFSSNGFDADRFMVKLSPDAQENANGNFAYWNGNNWMVEGNGTLQVFDALGRQLLSQEISNSNFEIQNSLFPAAGVYVLRMGEKTQKIVVR